MTHGVALARLGCHAQSLTAFLRAVEISEQNGTVNRASEAALTMVRELGKHLAASEGRAVVSADALGQSRLLYEHNLIKRALDRAEGSITHAARLLGITHQSLGYMLKTRHKDLISSRTPAKPRRKSKYRARPLRGPSESD